MPTTAALAERIDAEFAAAKQKVTEAQQQSILGFQEKKQRLELFEKTLDELRDVVRPRLETLAKRFTDQVKTKRPARNSKSGSRSARSNRLASKYQESMARSLSCHATVQ